MLATIEALLAGAMTPAEARAWGQGLLGEAELRRNPFSINPDAAVVFESLLCIGELAPSGEPVVREVDLRGYRRWLVDGAAFIGTGDPMVHVVRDIDALASEVGGEPIRFWNAGLGWFIALRFCAPATGRPFVAFGELDHPGGVSVHFRRDDVASDALVELFETLGIDDRDVRLHPTLDADALPEWALWREDDNANRFEIERYRCYAKAAEQERVFEARGHRQSYWVDPI